MSEAKCKHCGRPKVNRPRGLFWQCYYTPGVKDQNPSTSKHARFGVRDFCGPAPLPREPTTARAGSPEKIAVFAARAEAGENLFHPEDSLEEQEGRHVGSNSQGGGVFGVARWTPGELEFMFGEIEEWDQESKIGQALKRLYARSKPVEEGEGS